MYTLSLVVIVVGNIFLGVIAWIYLRRFKASATEHTVEVERRERELRRHVLELQVLRSLAQRAGYDLDLRQTLEVIIDNLDDLVEYDVVSYILLSREGKLLCKIYNKQPVSHLFLAQVKNQLVTAFSTLTRQDFQTTPIEEIISGASCNDTHNFTIESFVNFPLVIQGQITAIISLSSAKKNLYTDEETAILNTIFNQISAQATKLAQLIENEKKRLSVAVSSSTDGIMMVDANFNLIITNPVLPKLLGLPDGVSSFFEVIAKLGNQADLKNAIEQAFSTQNLVRLTPCRINGKDMQIEVEPLFNKDQFGYFLGVAVIFHDLMAAKQVDRLREEFTAMMIHELRTPLTTIVYSTDMILSSLTRLSKEDLSQNITIIQSTADNMLSLVDELLDIAKIEAGKFTVVKEEENLNKLLEEKVAAFKPLTDQKKLKLVLETDPNLNSLPFDRNRMGEVIDNLLSNAIKYTDDGEIRIKSEKQDGQVLISVTDSGEGIDKHDLPKLFSKFEQLGRGKTGDKVGTGLGLVVSKGIIEAHGGKIWAFSEGLSKGSTFTFTIPLD